MDALEKRLLLAADYDVTYGPFNYAQPAYGATAVVGNDLYFWDIESDTGAELHKLDTNTGIKSLVLDINPGIASSHVSDTDRAGFAAVGNYLYFVAFDPVSGEKRLRRIDLSQPTIKLETVGGQLPQYWDSKLITVGSKVYFLGDNEVENRLNISTAYWTDSAGASSDLESLLLTDGGIGNYVQARQYQESDKNYVVYGDRLFFWARNLNGDTSVRWIDTASETPVMQTLAVRGSYSWWDLPPRTLQIAEGKLFFTDYDSGVGSELRWIDLSEELPEVHTIDIVPGPTGSNAGSSGFAVIESKLYFAANDEGHGTELHSIDLRAESLDVQLIELVPGSEGALPSTDGGLLTADHKLYMDLDADSDDPKTGWIDTRIDKPELNYINESIGTGSSFLAGDKIFTTLYDSQDGTYHLNFIDTKNAPSTVQASCLTVPKVKELVDVPRFTQIGERLYFLARNPSKFAIWHVNTASMVFAQDYLFVIDGKYGYKGSGYFTGSAGYFQGRVTFYDKSYSINFDHQGKARLEWLDGKRPDLGFQILPDVELKASLGAVKSKLLFLGNDDNQKLRLYWIDMTLDTPIAHAGGLWPENSSINYAYGKSPVILDNILFIDTSTSNKFSMVWLDASEESPTFNKLNVPEYGELSSPLSNAGANIYFTRETPAGDSYLLQRIELTDGKPVVRTLTTLLDSAIKQYPSAPYQDYSDGRSQFVLVDSKLYIATSYQRYGRDWVTLKWLDITLDSPVLNESALGPSPIEADGIGIFGSFDGKLLFSVSDSKPGYRLSWVDTRTAPDIIRQVDISYPDGSFANIADGITYVDGNAYFTIYDGRKFELCWVDLATEHTQLNWLKSEEQYLQITYGDLLVIDSRIYFQGRKFSDASLFWIDTSLNDPIPNTIDIDPDPNARALGIDYLYKPSTGNRLYFGGYQAEFGKELMWIDLKDPNPAVHTIDISSGSEDSQPWSFLDYGGKLFSYARLNKYIGALVTVDTIAVPSDIELSQSALNENLDSDGAKIFLTSDDNDYGETFTYSLVSGDGDEDNDLFSIVDDKLVLNASFDFETKSSYTIRLRTTDSTNSSFEKSFVINVNDVPEAPRTKPDSYDIPANYMRDITDAAGSLTSTVVDNGVLANDSDDEGDSFSAILLTPPLHGTLVFNRDGTFRYHPAPYAIAGQNESFTYQALDSTGQLSEETVSLNIVGDIDSPFHNLTNPNDVSPGSSPGTISSLDVLAIINFLNYNRGRISIPVQELPQVVPPVFYYDVNNDFVVGALDILAVINFNNARNRGLIGESTKTAVSELADEVDQVDLYDAALVDLSDLPNKRRAQGAGFSNNPQ